MDEGAPLGLYFYVLSELAEDFYDPRFVKTPVPARDVYTILLSDEELKVPCGDTFIDFSPFELAPNTELPVAPLFLGAAEWAEWDLKGMLQVISLSPLGTVSDVVGVKSFQYRASTDDRMQYTMALPAWNTLFLQGPPSLTYEERLDAFERKERLRRAGLVDPNDFRLLDHPTRQLEAVENFAGVVLFELLLNRERLKGGDGKI